MAKGKKNAELSLEERLEAAVVPNWEQPYQVPANWCWTHLGDYIDYATDYVANGSFASLKANVRIYKEENYALMVKTADFANGFSESLTFTDKHGYDYLTKSKLMGGELILSNIGSIGKVFRVPYFNRPMTLASNSIMIKCHNELDYDWLYYYFLSPMGYSSLRSITTGTALLKFNKTQLKELPIAVPPTVEQRRIVDRIESLFAKLDEAKEKAQAVVDGFEERKAAILHKAFAGDLTDQWRANRSTSNTAWKSTFVGKCITLLSGQDFKPEQYNSEERGLPYITGASNFDREHVSINRWTEEPTVIAQKNDVLLVCKGSGYGKTIIADFNNAHIARQIMALRVGEQLINSYLLYFLQSEYEYLRNNGQGLIPGISRRVILDMKINLPTKEEQEEIVSILDRLIKNEQQAKESAEYVVGKIDGMKKSILARAFRGELGTNDPEDESAVELLKRIL